MQLQTETPNRKNSHLTIYILGGVILLVIATALFKTISADKRNPVTEAPDVQLERYQAQAKPVMVFFHSPDCRSCLQVQKSIDEVYPEFKESVGLVDVAVLEPVNQDYVKRTGVHSTPTLIFIGISGTEKVVAGEISAEALRNELIALIGGTP